MFSYAEPPSSGDEDEDDELSESGRGGGGRNSKTKGPTKRAKGQAKAVEVDDGDEGDEDVRPRKKARGPAKGKQRKQNKVKGQLEALKQLPVEMITEIFSHLDPDDLLTLSMVNKQYRSLLLAKSSARLWKAARARLDLPDWTTGGFTEWQYAQLAFGKKCQECGTTKAARPDYGIRKRLCKVCRMSGMLRLNWKKHRISGIHPLAHQCILRPLHTPAELNWLATAPHALEVDLRYWSGKLWELEDDAADTDASESDNEQPATTSTSSAAPAARSTGSTRTSTLPSYKEDSSDDEDPVSKDPSRRVVAFVAARQPFLDKIEEEGKDVFYASKNLREKIRARKVEHVSFDDRMAQLDRAEEIADKVLEFDPKYGSCVEDPAFSSHKLVKLEEPLTDPEWERIKPDILKLVERIKKKQDRDAMHLRLLDRQRSLRPRYDKLKKALPPSARPFVPLFIDFLVLSSVKALWQDETIKLDDAAWYERLDDIKDELDQYRLDLVLHAREIVVAARVDPDDEASAPDRQDDVLELGDDFLNLATSFVCCAFTDCDRTPVGPDRTHADRVKDVIGPLRRVLDHQHEWHNQADSLAGPRSFSNVPQLRIALPLEVACAIDALIDLAKLDPADATRDDFVRFNKLVVRYEWDSPGASWKRHWWNYCSAYSDRQGWHDLLLVIKLEAQRAAAAKPPYSVDPPVVVCQLSDSRDWDKLPLPKTPPKPANKKKRPPPSSDDSDSDDDGFMAILRRNVLKHVKDEEVDELASEGDEETAIFGRRVVRDSEDDDDGEDEDD
ncbi:hypothetical protein JCM3775_000229 [Rhodotorula graminis]